MAKGWECPKCGSVYAPHVRECDTCKNSKVHSGGDCLTSGYIFEYVSPSKAKITPLGWIDDSVTMRPKGRPAPIIEPLPTVTIPADGTSKGYAGEA